MRKRTLVAGLAAAAVVAAGVAVYAQPYGYGPGWMMGGGGPGWMMNGGGPGYGGGSGPGMMGYGGGCGPGTMGGPGYGGGYGPGWMHGYARDLDLGTEQVKAYLGQMIRNPRLKVGEVKQADDDTITAEVVTKDKDAVVQRFTVNRHTGYWRPDDAP